jgi:hypothetical protein
MKNPDYETASSPPKSRHRAQSWLEPKSLIVGGAAVAAIGLVFNWNWIVAFGFAPLLLFLPCMLMMGWMMWSMRSNKDADQPATRQQSTTQTSNDPPAAPSGDRSYQSNEE